MSTLHFDRPVSFLEPDPVAFPMGKSARAVAKLTKKRRSKKTHVVEHMAE